MVIPVTSYLSECPTHASHTPSVSCVVNPKVIIGEEGRGKDATEEAAGKVSKETQTPKLSEKDEVIHLLRGAHIP